MKKKKKNETHTENKKIWPWMNVHGLSARVFYSWDEDGWRQIIINMMSNMQGMHEERLL